MKLRVENLANIKEAEVEVKNLTLFVGQNSTHKSYMAHIIYELYKEICNLKNNWNKRNRVIANISKNLFSKYEKEISEILEIKKEISENIEKYKTHDSDDFELDISTVVKIKIENNQTFLFLQEKTKILVLQELTSVINSSFNSNSMIIEKIFLQNFDMNDKSKYITLRFNIPLEFFEEEKEDIRNRIVNNLVSKMIVKFEQMLDKYDTSYYFPASRTGFVLTLDEIYAGIFRDKFRGQVSATRLGEPTIDFIQTFADIKTGKHQESNLFNFRISYDKDQKKNSNKLVSFLEKNIIKGVIKEKRNEQDYASYFLGINNKEVDLHLASSATLETLPFIVFIKNAENITNTLFVIEEPEAHLHPKAQIQMAKFLVMLSNTGAKVLVTTHSDYILNEINNCIKLNSIEKENEFAISQENVSAYLFKNESNQTTVNELKIDKFGIANDNFDEVLDELLERSDELNEKILDKND